MRYRSVFLSDIHLGTRASKVEFLHRFLDQVEAEYVFLVGDIVDLARLRRRWYWPSSHRDVLRKLRDMAAAGTAVFYLPGNHDPQIRNWDRVDLHGLTFASEYVHKLADGRQLLITHGDMFDGTLHKQRLLGMLGCVLYAALVTANRAVNWMRRVCGMEYWSMADHVKRRVARVDDAIARFRGCLVSMARARGYDAILVGHVHIAELTQQEDVLYCNTGDWIDSCTAIVEEADGQLRLVGYTEWARHSVPTSFCSPIRAPAAEPARRAYA